MSTTATDIATHPAPPDLSDVPVHMVCHSCWPTPCPDQRAVCGDQPATLALDSMPDPFRPFCGVCQAIDKVGRCPQCGMVWR